MSSKILPADVLSTVMGLPIGEVIPSDRDPMERAVAALEKRRKVATRVRVIAYRYDGDGKGRDLCDKVQAGLQAGDLPFHDLCRALDADVQLIELGAGIPTAFDNARAAAFGMMAAEEDTGLLLVTGFGAEASAPKSTPDFLECAMPDTAAVFGAMVSAARAHIPIIAEGLKAYQAALALYALRPDLCAHILICGVPASIQDERFTIFADDKADHPLYAAAVLATALTNAFQSRQAA